MASDEEDLVLMHQRIVEMGGRVTDMDVKIDAVAETIPATVTKADKRADDDSVRAYAMMAKMRVDDSGFDGVMLGLYETPEPGEENLTIMSKDEAISAAFELAQASTMLQIMVDAANGRSPDWAVDLDTAKEKVSDAKSTFAAIVEDTYAEQNGDVDGLALPACQI
ncbi:hypothetical protein JG687_00015900 [Phytophthora cactorum]|uniref:Uncharacterized protein n=1 Tax=Phytophthora cactorum TaxID=29920 RepID=A0A8T1TVM8_9STRA|nr:hypothetical protein JG687_00015900 [Phytophthora cactorum]